MNLGAPLVTLDYGDGIAAILREEDGSVWLTGNLEAGGGTGITDVYGAIEGLDEDSIVQGGLLPDGAVRVEVVHPAGQRVEAAVGGGAWVVVIDHPLYEPTPVRFAAADGASVRRALPAEWPSEPVPDAVEPCPACGAAVWEEVTPLDGSRGMHGSSEADMRPCPIVVCCECGHEEGSGGWVSVGSDDLSEEEHEQRVAAFEREQRKRDRAMLARLTIPVYALADWDGERSLGGWGGSEPDVTAITVVHGQEGGTPPWVRVEFDTDVHRRQTPEAMARDLIAHLRSDESWPEGRSMPALTIWLRHRDREATRRAAAAKVVRATVDIDGISHDVSAVEEDDMAACVVELPSGQLTVVGRGVALAGLRLVTLEDPAGTLAG